MIIVSGCLVGLKCRFDGKYKVSKEFMDLMPKGIFIPVCPEQLGGLPTPRIPCWIEDGDGYDVLFKKSRVVNQKGEDLTEFFKKGAKETAKIANFLGINVAVFKEKSPSCGVNFIYHGDKLVKGCGVTTAILIKMGIHVLDEKSFIQSFTSSLY